MLTFCQKFCWSIKPLKCQTKKGILIIYSFAEVDNLNAKESTFKQWLIHHDYKETLLSKCKDSILSASQIVKIS